MCEKLPVIVHTPKGTLNTTRHDGGRNYGRISAGGHRDKHVSIPRTIPQDAEIYMLPIPVDNFLL